MAVIDICKTAGAIVKQGRVGLGFNPEMVVELPAQLFDGTQGPDDVLIYRTFPEKVIFKGIVRSIQRSLSGESVTVTAAAAESVLEGFGWTPTMDGYNIELISPKRIMNATFADLITQEFTNNATGPQTWFTSIEVPPSVASLVIAPVETYQSSFISLIESALANYEHVKWFIEYKPDSTNILPLGKLVLVDTSIGRTTKTLVVGGASGNVSDANVNEDYSTCAKEIRVYGGGDFVETDEVLEPAWDLADEDLRVTLEVPCPLESDLLDGVVPTSYIPWGYDLMGLISATLVVSSGIGTSSIPIWYGKDFWLDTDKGTLKWNQYNGSVLLGPQGQWAQMVSGPPPAGYRPLAFRIPGFFGAKVILQIVYAGQDCYRLYKVSKPIKDVRYRMTKKEDPKNLGSIIDTPVEQEKVIDAFMPYQAYDFSKYVSQPTKYLVAKVLVPDDDGVYWDERNPQFASAKGYSIPITPPDFEPGRKYVRFEQRQLGSIVPAIVEITPDGPIGPTIQWITWQIKVRYTAWNDWYNTEVGVAGIPYIGRFIFDSVRKFTDFSGKVLLDKTDELDELSSKTKDFYGNAQWSGNVSVVVDMGVSGDYKVSTLSIGVGDKITISGAVDSGISTRFFGIVNDIDIPSLEAGLASIGVGPRNPDRNPFSPKPPEYVDREAVSRIVYDRSVFDRRSQ